VVVKTAEIDYISPAHANGKNEYIFNSAYFDGAGVPGEMTKNRLLVINEPSNDNQSEPARDTARETAETVGTVLSDNYMLTHTDYTDEHAASTDFDII
jgi:hypothetical protein